MVKNKGLLAAAAIAALTLGAASQVRAEQAPAMLQPAYLANSGTSYKPLMTAIGGAESPLAKAGINIGGYVEASFTHNFDHAVPGNTKREFNNLRLFDFENNDPTLNQLDLQISREIPFSKTQFDVGFRVETIFGGDARFLQSNGLNPYGSGSGFLTPTTRFQRDPDQQIALYQAYVDFNLPFGDGVNLRIGKFASFFGSAVDPTKNSMYSHTIAFGFFRPLTLTGALVSAKVGDSVVVEAGLSRGWEQSMSDNNDAIDAFARVIWSIDEKTKFSLAAITGPENTGDNSNYSTVIEALLQYRASDKLRLAADATFGQLNGLSIERFDAGSNSIVTDQDDVTYVGLTGYAGYTINPNVTVNGRLEYFHVSNARFLLADTSSGASVASLTIGTTLTPMPDDVNLKYLKVRPEVRLDWASEDIFRRLDSSYQITFGVDVLYQF